MMLKVVAAIALSQLSFIIIQCSLQIINFIGNMHGGNNLTLNCSKYYVQIPILFLACKQALHLWDIVKSRRARGTRKETRKRGLGKRKAFPQPLAQSSRSSIGELARRLFSFQIRNNCGIGLYRSHRKLVLVYVLRKRSRL